MLIFYFAQSLTDFISDKEKTTTQKQGGILMFTQTVKWTVAFITIEYCV